MPKYTILRYVTLVATITVESDSLPEALECAYDQDIDLNLAERHGHSFLASDADNTVDGEPIPAEEFIAACEKAWVPCETVPVIN